MVLFSILTLATLALAAFFAFGFYLTYERIALHIFVIAGSIPFCFLMGTIFGFVLAILLIVAELLVIHIASKERLPATV